VKVQRQALLTSAQDVGKTTHKSLFKISCTITCAGLEKPYHITITTVLQSSIKNVTAKLLGVIYELEELTIHHSLCTSSLLH
jgi:hypothetical protein